MDWLRRIEIVMMGIVLCVSSAHSSNDKYWQAVDTAVHNGLPRTAIKNLDIILRNAQKEGNNSEWLEALTRKVVIEASIEGNAPEEKVKRMQAEFSHADANIRPLLQAILAEWYWQYYNRNRWRFLNRTATEKLSEKDFTTWDLPKIFREIDSLYSVILKEKDRLTRIPIQRFLDFLEQGSMPVELSPTLYDFLAHEALQFYTSAEQAAAHPEDAFELDANSDAFAPTDLFLKFTPVTKDTGSPKYQALKLYQSLIAFHEQRGDTVALLGLEIERLRYVKNAAFGDERNQIFIRRMTDIIEKYRGCSVSSLGSFYLAKAWAEEGDLAKAFGVAKRGYEDHPGSVGGKSCHAYTIELTARSLRLSGEKYIPSGPSQIAVSYKNFTRLYVRIYADTWNDFLKTGGGLPNQLDSTRMKKLLADTPVAQWRTDLSATDDLREKEQLVDVPTLKPGYYRLLASPEPDFGNSTMLQHTWLWVCSFTLVLRSEPGLVSGLVVDAVTGEPIREAEVRKIYGNSFTGEHATTNADGYFEFGFDHRGSFLVSVKKGDEELVNYDGVYSYERTIEKPEEHVFFFTDRSLYRPGQIIYFKGICVHIGRAEQQYEVIPDRTVVVHFRDSNYKEISSLTLRTNDFGSFSGQFTAPVDRLTGQMSLQAENPSGRASIRVEEYKRPKFTVELQTPKQAVRLNQEIEIRGRALAYTGAPIDNASVRFTVVREVSYPHWWYWYHHGSSSQNQSQNIAHGKITTDAEGNFRIPFVARPDLKVSSNDNPTFTYSIHADVTSPDGETRSGNVFVRIGYSALELHVASGEQAYSNQRIPLVIATRTLDGNPLPANVRIRIYALKEPETPIRDMLRSDYWNTLSIEDTSKGFGEDWRTWPTGAVVYATTVTTGSSQPDTLRVTLPGGLYKVDCAAKDAYQKEVTALLPLMILPDPDSKHFTLKLPSMATVTRSVVRVGEELEAFWGTGYESGRCFIEIEHDGKILKSYWTEQGRTQHAFTYPVTKDLRGGFTVHFTQVRENRAYFTPIPVSVPWENKELHVALESFRDKGAPGEKETITLKVRDDKNASAEAELAATLYDFSLDQFYPHSWNGFHFFKYAYSQRHETFINSTRAFAVWTSDRDESISYPPISFVRFPGYITEYFFSYRLPRVQYRAGRPRKAVHGSAKVTYGKQSEFAGDFGRFNGSVVDAETGEPLPGANVVIKGTNLGGVTHLNGGFVIQKIPKGEYTVRASFVGYKTIAAPKVKAEPGRTTTIDFSLEASTISGQAVEVTAQAKGQMAAINQQLASNAVANVVSVEAIKALPGVSLRGLSGEANAILAPGEEGKAQPGEVPEISVRRNLNETAFFSPHLLTDKDGTIKIEFTMPEALTRWKFIGFAHGKECENGIVTGYTITQKELMVQPNAPRFLREGDTISFTAKVVNMSDRPQNGSVQLSFKDLNSEQPMNANLDLADSAQNFDIKAHASEAFSWNIHVPRGTGPLSYTVTAKSQAWSDGEAGSVPVLSSRIFLTESLPISIRGPKTKTFAFDRLKPSGRPKSFEPFRFTIQMASNPIWYAIQALPYLVEFPYECAEQVFNRFYANSLAGFIVRSNPRIREIIGAWRGTDALKSNLEKNTELKSVMLMETPWVLQAEAESQAKRNIAILFEENTLNSNLNSALSKLSNLQSPEGGWSWFPGGRPDDYITLYIVTGFGRLSHLGVTFDRGPALKGVNYLDQWIVKSYERRDKTSTNVNPAIALYLYCRTFYLRERPVSGNARQALEYFLDQGRKHWLSLNSRLSQGYLALALHRFGDTDGAKRILASLKERSIQDEEMGMFWRDAQASWWWYRAPIETQALLIEAFDEISHDTTAVDECKVWLLKQKQTQNWKTTKATADAIYALVLRGTDELAAGTPVEIRLAGESVPREDVEAGTGFYEKMYTRSEIKPGFSAISVVKGDHGIAWGGAHLQYFVEMPDAPTHATNLQLEKSLFLKKTTKKGTVIEPIAGPLSVGDVVTVRITLRVDRDMEYVHLKDMRGSGLEPVDVLSRYRYQDGLAYYQSTKDAATHFFIDYLPRGTYVFEYDLRVQLKGRYQNGVAEIQSMYAPEFNSHSASQLIEVQ